MSSRRTPLAWCTLTAVGASILVSLTGCQPGIFDASTAPASPPHQSPAGPTAGTTAAPSAAPSTSTAPSASSAPSESAEPTTSPVAGDIPCDRVLTADQLYEFSPNFAPVDDAGDLTTAVADLVTAGATACAYRHVTGTDRLTIAVLASSSAGDDLFAVESGVGTLVSGTDPVIAVSSEYFGTPDDASPVIDQVRKNLE